MNFKFWYICFGVNDNYVICVFGVDCFVVFGIC